MESNWDKYLLNFISVRPNIYIKAEETDSQTVSK